MKSLQLKSGMILLLLTVSSVYAQIVNRFEGDRFTQYASDDWISYAPALDINAIDTDDEFVYFATKKGGILRFDKYSGEWDYPFTVSTGLRSNQVYDITYNKLDGRLYARIPQGIDVLNFADNFWQPFSGSSMPVKRVPSIEDVAGIQKGKNFRFPPYYRPQNEYFPNFFPERSIIFMPPDEVWDRKNRIFSFTDRMVDEWNRLWLGSNGLGPLYGDLFSFNLHSKPQSISNISVRDVYLDDATVWIGGINEYDGIGGITEWNGHTGNWNYYEAQFNTGISRDDVRAIDGNDNFITFATNYGLVIFDKKKETWKTVTGVDGLDGDEVRDVIIVNNVAYAATENGLNWINLKSKRRKAKGFIGTPIDNVPINQLAIYQDNLQNNNHKIYAATRNGLYSLATESEEVTFVPAKSAVPDINFKAIETVNDTLWIAGDYGVVYYDLKQNTWHSFPALSLKTEFRDIASTDNTIWFATKHGLLKFGKRDNYWRLFTTKDGLISNDVYHIDPDGDELWISTSKGVTVFRHNRVGRLD